MSLEDHYDETGEGDHAWRADWSGSEGTLTTGALPDDFNPHNFDEVLTRLGYAPGEISMELVSASRWEQRSAVRDEDGRRTGEMTSTYLNAYKYKALRSALNVNLPALYAEVRRTKPSKKEPVATGRTAVVCWADIQVGKALADDTPVLTTEGWKNHGDIRPGDYVYGPDGLPKRVYGVTGSTVQKLYRVEFDRGVSIVATGDHLWQGWRKYRTGDKRVGSRTDDTRRYGGGGRYEWRELTWTTSQIATLNGKQRSFQVDLTAPLDYPEADLPIDPYLLGVWLGDGNSHNAHITVGREDEEWVTRLGTLVPSNCTDTKIGVHVPGLRTKLREAGLLRNKHIPAQYLTASAKQRLALVQGLMDTDGFCDRRGMAEFCNTNFDLADGMCWLLASLGFKYTRTERVGTLNGQQHKPFVRVSIPTRPDVSLFTMRRKAERESVNPQEQTLRRQVQRVVPVGKGSAQCLNVEGGLYLAGRELVLTHNCDHLGGLTEMLNRLEDKREALKNWLKEAKVDHVVLADVGDIVEGFENTSSQTRTNCLSLMRQVDVAATELWKTLKVCEKFGPVDVLAIPSNHCVDADTEILTPQGWVRVEDFAGTGEIAAYDPESDSLRWQPVLHWTAKSHNGRMLHVNSRTVDHMVTEDHDLYGRGKGTSRRKPMVKIKAQEAFAKSGWEFLQTAGAWEGKTDFPAPSGFAALSSDPMLAAKFYGWYVSEGSCYIRDARSYNVVISQSKDVHPDNYAEIDQTWQRLGRTPSRDSKTLTVGSRSLSEFLREHFGCTSGEKRLPAWLKDAPTEVLVEFMRSYLLGDGTKNAVTTWWGVCSKSKQLMDDLQEICLRLGWRMVIDQRLHEFPVSGTDYVGNAYRGYINQRRRGATIEWAHPGREQNGSWVDYQGMVYCPTVATGLWFARRNGKVVVTGNCQWRKGKGLIGTPTDDWGLHINERLEQLNDEAGLRATFHRPPDWEETLEFKIRGTVLGLAHGHQANSPDRIRDWLSKMILGGVLNCDILVTGHFHHFIMRPVGKRPDGRIRWHIQCPTLDNGSAWVRNKMGEDGDPALAVFVVDDDGFNLRSLALL